MTCTNCDFVASRNQIEGHNCLDHFRLEIAKEKELTTTLYREIDFLRNTNVVLQAEKQQSQAEMKKVLIEKEKLVIEASNKHLKAEQELEKAKSEIARLRQDALMN
jgi:hypothetical protein